MKAATAFLPLALTALFLAGCGPKLKVWTPDDKPPRVFAVNFRKLPPEPVYNRMGWAHLPSPLPAGELPDSDGPQVMPALRLDLKNVTLESAGKALATGANYGCYTASTVATNKVTLNKIGTLDELAAALAKQAGARAIVDHSVRQLRFLGGIQDSSSQ